MESLKHCQSNKENRYANKRKQSIHEKLKHATMVELSKTYKLQGSFA